MSLRSTCAAFGSSWINLEAEGLMIDSNDSDGGRFDWAMHVVVAVAGR